MLTEIYHTFETERRAKRILTQLRKAYRIALRGAVVCPYACPRGPGFRIHAPLGGTGMSGAEFASACAYAERLEKRDSR